MSTTLKDGYNVVPNGLTPQINNGIRIVKSRAMLPDQKAKMMANLNHLEMQLGRLAQTCREMRAELLNLME